MASFPSSTAQQATGFSRRNRPILSYAQYGHLAQWRLMNLRVIIPSASCQFPSHTRKYPPHTGLEIVEGFQDPNLFRGGIRRQLWPGFQKHGKLLHTFTKADDIGSDERVFSFHFTYKLKMAGPASPAVGINIYPL